MKVSIANYDPSKKGGGWSFLDNFTKSFEHDPDAEIFFIAGPTLATHEEVEQAKRQGKKVVVRLDNAVRDSRNRGTGMSRMKAFTNVADLVIYQSEWAKRFLYPFTKKDGPVILNGVDTKKFNSKNRTVDGDSYLYVRSSRDEGKQWVMAWYWFTELNKPEANLDIVGKFSADNWEWGFDFFKEEKWKFWGERRDLPELYKRNKYFLYTYTNDACSNTLLEARASGCEIIDVYGQLQTGGAPEIMGLEDLSKERMVKQYEEELAKL